MATDKLFMVAGVSELNGVFKVRYANSVKRGAVLAKNGHTNIVLVDLGDSMCKVDCVDQLLTAVARGYITGAGAEAVREEAREMGFIL